MASAPAPAPAEPGEGGLRRYRAMLAYDGTRFHGWARQPGLATVEAIVFDGLTRVVRHEPVALTCAGRTDAGVHARGQVVHFDVAGDPDPYRLLRRLNGVLPPDIRVRSLDVAPDGFDARFSALWRRYEYRVCDGVPDPLTRQLVLAVRGSLDVAAMAAAVRPLVGLHDFMSFCKPRAGATTMRGLLECSWDRTGEVVELGITGDAFCHSMVRAIVGASLEVGLGRRPTDWLAQLLARPSRDAGSPVAPPHGLILAEVRYPPDYLLAARAEQSRHRRS